MTPEQIIKRHQDFLEWKRDLEQRLEEHLKKNPELIKKFRPQDPQLDSQALAPHLGIHYPLAKQIKKDVQVLKSELFKGRWVVWETWVDGYTATSFDGPTAHAKALRYAERLKNSENQVVGEPCIFCGGRSGHREGCPELNTDFIG